MAARSAAAECRTRSASCSAAALRMAAARGDVGIVRMVLEEGGLRGQLRVRRHRRGCRRRRTVRVSTEMIETAREKKRLNTNTTLMKS